VGVQQIDVDLVEGEASKGRMVEERMECKRPVVDVMFVSPCHVQCKCR